MTALLQRHFGKLAALATVGFLLGTSGCALSDSNDMSEQPWNAPKTWETGVPQSMQQGR